MPESVFTKKCLPSRHSDTHDPAVQGTWVFHTIKPACVREQLMYLEQRIELQKGFPFSRQELFEFIAMPGPSASANGLSAVQGTWAFHTIKNNKQTKIKTEKRKTCWLPIVLAGAKDGMRHPYWAYKRTHG